MELLIPAGVALFMAATHITMKPKPINNRNVKTTINIPVQVKVKDEDKDRKEEEEIIVDENVNIITGNRFKTIVFDAPTADGGNEKISERISRQVMEDYFGKPFPKLSRFVKNPLTTGYLELDGFCKELKIAFEYQGEQHYKFPSKWITTKEDFKKQIWKDAVKKKACESCGILLVIIPYTLWFVEGRKTQISRNEFISRLRDHIRIILQKKNYKM